MNHLKMKRKSISKIVRLLLNNEISMDKARSITGLKESQLKQLVDARIVNNSRSMHYSVYQSLVLVGFGCVNVSNSKITRDRYNRLCVSVLGVQTPLFNY